MRRSHVELRSKRYAPIQSVSDTHTDKKSTLKVRVRLTAKDIFDAIVVRLRARAGTARQD